MGHQVFEDAYNQVIRPEPVVVRVPVVIRVPVLARLPPPIPTPLFLPRAARQPITRTRRGLLATSILSSPPSPPPSQILPSVRRLWSMTTRVMTSSKLSHHQTRGQKQPKQCDTYVALCGHVSESFCCYPFSKHLLFDFRLPASIYDGKLSPCESARHLTNTLTVAPRTGTSQSTTARSANTSRCVKQSEGEWEGHGVTVIAPRSSESSESSLDTRRDVTTNRCVEQDEGEW